MEKIHLIVDGMLSGTGIRDSINGGYIKPSALGISAALTSEIADWLLKYAEAHYNQFNDAKQNRLLDHMGIGICKRLGNELPEAVVEYYSNAELRKIT